jgi:hypothetical protein
MKLPQIEVLLSTSLLPVAVVILMQDSDLFGLVVLYNLFR